MATVNLLQLLFVYVHVRINTGHIHRVGEREEVQYGTVCVSFAPFPSGASRTAICMYLVESIHQASKSMIAEKSGFARHVFSFSRERLDKSSFRRWHHSFV